MSDSYQAIYDAVRSRIHGCDVASAVRDAVRYGFDASHAIAVIQQDFCIAAGEMQRPSVLYRPELTSGGEGQWFATFGAVVGCGDSPEKAMADFDTIWKRASLPLRPPA